MVFLIVLCLTIASFAGSSAKRNPSTPTSQPTGSSAKRNPNTPSSQPTTMPKTNTIEVFFIRHGQSTANCKELGDSHGDTRYKDTKLSKSSNNGEQQVKTLRDEFDEWFSGDKNDIIPVSSPLRRAFATTVFAVRSAFGDSIPVYIAEEMKEKAESEKAESTSIFLEKNDTSVLTDYVKTDLGENVQLQIKKLPNINELIKMKRFWRKMFALSEQEGKKTIVIGAHSMIGIELAKATKLSEDASAAEKDTWKTFQTKLLKNTAVIRFQMTDGDNGKFESSKPKLVYGKFA